ncbi:MAG: endonuclease III, partial [Candidatus Bathyarchaeota archaeon]
FNGDLATVMGKPYHEARGDLMSLPGVGPKTADVVLMFVAGKKIVPVDRHIFRVAKRLRLVREKASYDEVREVLEAASPEGRHEDIHVFLIRFGRETCRARIPRCSECFLEDLCPFPEKTSE